MVAYSFKARFAPLIADGSKTQTVRADRKRHARPSETLQLYTGMRTRVCRLVATSTCVSVAPIRFDFTLGAVGELELPGQRLRHRSNLDIFARHDGFADWDDLRAFWAAAHPGMDQFEGVLIRWHDLVVAG